MPSWLYKDRLIVPFAFFNAQTGSWSRGAHVSWRAHEERALQVLNDNKVEFKLQQEALDSAVDLAKRWVDEQDTQMVEPQS